MPTKTIIRDSTLHFEAYRFTGLAQPFPSHFHEHYVIGLIEQGERRLSCNGCSILVTAGSLLLFHPGEPHSCEQEGSALLDYRALNLPPAILRSAAEGITGRSGLPHFSTNVLKNEALAHSFLELHRALMKGADSCTLAKEERLYLFLSQLLRHEAPDLVSCPPEQPDGTEQVCAYLENHFAEHITLDQLCGCACLSKSTLLRAFTRAKGMTPYRYLESIRVNHAKRLLESGASPAEAAQRAGFSDQSHLTGYFSRFLGLTPGAYRELFREYPREETSHRPADTGGNALPSDRTLSRERNNKNEC